MRALGSTPLLLACACAAAAQQPRILTHDNRVPAGTLRGGVLTLRLEARTGAWYPEAEDGVGLPVAAFALAKDGADLPPSQATVRQARQRLAEGETYDFAFTPATAGDLRLELRAGRVVLATLPLQVG